LTSSLLEVLRSCFTFDKAQKMSTQFLHQLLQKNLQSPPEYRGGFSNHRAMALHALHALGAGDARLQTFYNSYEGHFSSTTPQDETTAPDHAAPWNMQLGKISAFTALEAQFATMLARDGINQTLAAVLPILWPGLAGAAFHGLIRTAHAVEMAYQPELAAALAYWAARWQATPVPATERSLPFAEWATQLQSAATQQASTAPSISRRMAEAIKTNSYANLAGSLKIEADTIENLSHWIARRYSESNNFTVLHMLTGVRAALVLLPFMSAEQADGAIKQAISGLVAAYFASNIGAAAPAISQIVMAADWNSFITKAVAATDEHDIKLMHALDWFYKRDPDPAYVAAAARLFMRLGS
jgi:Questin oxidase-like